MMHLTVDREPCTKASFEPGAVYLRVSTEGGSLRGGVLFQRTNQDDTHSPILSQSTFACSLPDPNRDRPKEVVVTVAHGIVV